MAEQIPDRRRSRFWIIIVGVIILLVFAYFYQPFEAYLTQSIPNIHFHNVIFWFASLVAVIGYAISHWQSFRRNIVGAVGDLDVEGLVYDTLQIAILTAVIFTAGATLQAVEMLSEHLMDRGPILDAAFGGRVLSIILLVILAVLFYLLHYLVRSIRIGWRPRRPPPRSSTALSEASSSPSGASREYR